MTQMAAKSISDKNTTSPRRILVMDDDANLRYIYRQALHQAGYEVHLAATIQEARSLLEAIEFDVFLGDTHLEGRHRGADLLREQIDTLIQKGTRILMLSSHTHYRSICEEMGVNMFVEKPVGINRLVTLVDRLAAERGEQA